VDCGEEEGVNTETQGTRRKRRWAEKGMEKGMRAGRDEGEGVESGLLIYGLMAVRASL
jgi:hypothetical protein